MKIGPRASMKQLKANTMYFKKWKGQGPIKQRREILRKYTASVQQIGRKFRDKGEKEWKGPQYLPYQVRE